MKSYKTIINELKVSPGFEEHEKEEPPIKVGDIYYCSWGYDQTNIDWYKVVAFTGKTAKFQRIESKNKHNTSTMTGTTMPDINKPKKGEKILTKKIQNWNGDIYIKMDQGSLRKWDGKPKSYSSYA